MTRRSLLAAPLAIIAPKPEAEPRRWFLMSAGVYRNAAPQPPTTWKATLGMLSSTQYDAIILDLCTRLAEHGVPVEHWRFGASQSKIFIFYCGWDARRPGPLGKGPGAPLAAAITKRIPLSGA